MNLLVLSGGGTKENGLRKMLIGDMKTRFNDQDFCNCLNACENMEELYKQVVYLLTTCGEVNASGLVVRLC